MRAIVLKKNFFFILVPSTLTVLIPIFLITGPFLSDLAVSIVAILFIINSIKNKLVKYYKNIFFFFFILFYLYLVISSLLSQHTLFSLKTSIFYIRYGIFALSTWYLLENNKKFAKYFFTILLFCFTSLIIDGFFQYIFGTNILGFELVNVYRVSSFFNEELILGSYISRLTPLLIGLFIILEIKKKYKIFFFIILILSSAIIFLSGERSSFFYYLITILYLGIFLNYKNIKLCFAISFLLIILIVSLKPTSKTRILDETINQLNFNNFETKNINYFSSVHTDHYISASKIFLDNIIIGSGPKTFRIVCQDQKYYINNNSCSTHPHHTYIQLLSETGIIGFLFVGSIFIYLFYISIKAFIQKFFFNKLIFSNFQFCMFISFFITLSPFTPSGNFFNNWLGIIYYIPIGFYLFYKKNI
jgi:O-antigen ligase